MAQNWFDQLFGNLDPNPYRYVRVGCGECDEPLPECEGCRKPYCTDSCKVWKALPEVYVCPVCETRMLKPPQVAYLKWETDPGPC